MTIGAHLLGIPFLVAYLAHEYRAWRRRTAAPEVMAAVRPSGYYWHSAKQGCEVAVMADAAKPLAIQSED